MGRKVPLEVESKFSNKIPGCRARYFFSDVCKLIRARIRPVARKLYVRLVQLAD
jgi:hypothetical protein